MPTAAQPLWTASCPPGWIMENDEDSVLLYDPEEGIGTLEISCFCKEEGATTDEELLDLAADTLAAGARRMDVSLGDMHGLMLSYSEDNMAWKEWYLAAGHCVFFITYDCPEDMEGAEDEELAAIIGSLKIKGSSE
ncbi:DUF3805 domain-containing protein [Sulfurivermis fontis]|jgi:hypothetical protein|uniref:DUF3805 domain-containing protein n=1 Tax=Sulfurivermis fontis TaxID=1972068 RepID=UPI000FD818B8|nr:DUF3805 domain-containing protein [Sulfurivermis fontis]